MSNRIYIPEHNTSCHFTYQNIPVHETSCHLNTNINSIITDVELATHIGTGSVIVTSSKDTAVMVHLEDTLLTYTAVMSPWCLRGNTHLAYGDNFRNILDRKYNIIPSQKVLNYILCQNFVILNI